MDKRFQKAKINAASTLLHQLIATCCGMIIPWIMIDTFGSAAYGATTSIAQFLSYISLFEGGIGRVARGALYGPLAQKDNENISRVYLAVKRFFTVLGVIFAGYSIVLAFCYHDIAEVSFFTREYTFMLVIAIAIGKFAEYMGGISNITLFNADQKQYVVNSAYIVTNIMNAALVLILATCGADILLVKLISSLIFVLKPVFYTLYLRKNYNIVRNGRRAKLENKFTGIAQHFSYVVYNNTDVLILTVLADLKAVAVYSVYHLVIFSIRNIVSSFTGGMEAVFGNMIAKGEEKELRDTYESYKMALTVLSVMFFSTTAILIVPFVKLYTAGVNDANYTQPMFALVMVLAEAINCLVLPCFNLSIAANKLKESQIGAYGEAFVNLAVSLVLVFWNPLLGVALGTLAAAVFKAVYYIAFSGKKVLKKNVFSMLRNAALTVVFIAVLSACGMTVTDKLGISNFFVWIILGVVSVAVTGAAGMFLGNLLYPGKTKDLKKLLVKGGNSSEKGDNSIMYDEYNKHDIAAYAGYVKDEKELLTCSSGGAATAFARQMISRGGYVAGVAYSDDFKKAEYRIADTIEKLEQFKGSKYTEVDKNGIYNEVRALLEADKEVLFFGLPCTVAALRSFLKKDYDKLVCVELICNGPTKAKVQKEYVEHLEKKYNSKVADFSVKHKKGKWTPGFLYARFADGQTFCEEFYHTEYGYAFSVLGEKRCYSCQFRGNNRTGDIMIGDFWGAVENDEFWNEKGVSAILAHNEKGNSFVLSCEDISLFESTFERIVQRNPNIIKPRPIRPETAKFEKLFEANDLFYSVNKSKKLKTKIKSIIKRIV